MVLLEDGSTNWIQIKEIKDSNPIEVAEYAVVNHIQYEPAFAWWVSKVTMRSNRIISKVKLKDWRTTHKFSIHLPKTDKEEFRFEKEAGNYYWERAPNKEISKVKVVWQRVGRFTPEQAR